MSSSSRELWDNFGRLVSHAQYISQTAVLNHKLPPSTPTVGASYPSIKRFYTLHSWRSSNNVILENIAYLHIGIPVMSTSDCRLEKNSGRRIVVIVLLLLALIGSGCKAINEPAPITRSLRSQTVSTQLLFPNAYCISAFPFFLFIPTLVKHFIRVSSTKADRWNCCDTWRYTEEWDASDKCPTAVNCNDICCISRW